MLTPTKLDKLPEPMVQLMAELQDDMIKDICRRITKANFHCRSNFPSESKFASANYLTPTAEWQLYKANQLRLSSADINRRIARQLKMRERTVKELYTEAVKAAIHEDAEIYRYAIVEGKLDSSYGERLSSYTRSVAFNDVFKQGLKNTNGLMRNLTNSMAAVSNRQLSDALDLAYLKVASGAFTPAQAIFEAVQKLGADGIKTVKYDSGRTDQVDVAVRRAVLTGINKTCCDMQLDLAKEMDCGLVEVSSHLGARPSHAEWQGQIYSLKKGHPKYPYFYDATGYGTGDGLGGWNCRHSFFPYFEGISEAANAPDFSKAENLEEYNNSQQQRAYERSIRKSKRELAAIDSARAATSDPELKAKLDRSFEKKSVTLKNREAKLQEFCRQTGSYVDTSRVRVDGFGKSVSQKAYHTANKSYTAYMHQLGIENPPKTIALFDKMMYNNSPEYQLMNKYMTSVKNGMLSPLAGYEKYKEYHERVEKEIIGIKTSNGIEIKSQSDHFLERVFGTMKDPHTSAKREGVDLSDIKDALLNGKCKPVRKEIDKNGNIIQSQLFYNDTCAVSINPITGTIIQCNLV